MRKNQTRQTSQPQEPQQMMFTLRSVAGRQNIQYVPQRGEPIYDIESQELVVGDGQTPMSMLRAIDNVVQATDGRLYTVAIDSEGHVVQTLPLSQPINYGGANVVMHLRAAAPLPAFFLN